MKLSISGLPITQPRRFTKDQLAPPETPDPEDSADEVRVLSDGRHVAEYTPGTWFEVDPVTNETDFDKRIDPRDLR